MIKLFLDNVDVGIVSDVEYETPWASGNVKFVNKSLFLKLVNITSMKDFGLETDELMLSEEEEEEVWKNKLLEQGLDWDDLDLCDDGKWSIQVKEQDRQEIYAVGFYMENFINWRGGFEF